MHPKPIPLEEASVRLTELVGLAAQGREVILGSENQPMVRLVLFKAPAPPRERAFGQYRGKIHLGDDFDAPLPDEFWAGDDA